ncbi:MAG: purine-nucleoside phosphorylase [Planctomycetota bacterium]|nr:purine-nucleoside phosphorylase [Planctomycetota bacterium]MEC9009126.1 purine-nucleoside phosphorylase [Planctomycetota bacterium]
MSELREQIEEACAVISAQWSTPPTIGLVLGTGLGGLAEQIETAAAIDYADIPHFPVSTAPSHAGRLVCGTLAGVPLVAMEGRFHFYEGYSLAEVTFPVRVMRLLGAETLMLTNAAGGMNPEFQLADVVAISDQMNLIGDNPLRGPNDDSLGPRFPDMCDPYDPKLIQLATECAQELGWSLKTGVFAAVAGPNLETRAEYRMLRRLGADLVGMSTVPECLVARHMAMRVLGFSIVTDMGLPEELHPVDINMVLEQAARGGQTLAELIPRIVARLA